MPKEKNPNAMEDFKAELEANKQIASDSKDSWNKWTEKKEMGKSIPLLIGGYIVYKFFL